MSGLNIKLADLQISDFHAPECCVLWWHTEKTFSFWGRCPQTPTRGFAPWPHWGPTAAPRSPHHFPPFSLFPSPMSVFCFDWLMVHPQKVRSKIWKYRHSLFGVRIEVFWDRKAWIKSVLVYCYDLSVACWKLKSHTWLRGKLYWGELNVPFPVLLAKVVSLYLSHFYMIMFGLLAGCSVQPATSSSNVFGLNSVCC